MNTTKRVEALIANGHEQSIIALCGKLEGKVELHKDLQVKLDGLGNTPVDEPDIYNAISKTKIDLANEVLSVDEIKSFKATEVGDFLYAVETKVSSLKDDEGFYKTTPNTEDCNLPNFLEVDEIMKISNKEREAKEALTTAVKDNNDKKIKKAVEQVEKVANKLKDECLKISGLDVEKLDDWEKILVTTQVYSASLEASFSALGKKLAI